MRQLFAVAEKGSPPPPLHPSKLLNGLVKLGGLAWPLLVFFILVHTIARVFLWSVVCGLWACGCGAVGCGFIMECRSIDLRGRGSLVHSGSSRAAREARSVTRQCTQPLMIQRHLRLNFEPCAFCSVRFGLLSLASRFEYGYMLLLSAI